MNYGIETQQAKRLLAVLAHPDDETFGMGGTLALYSRNGVDTHLICATRGEAGDMDEDCLDGYNSVAERREAELRCASGLLGLKEVHFLNYRDSGMVGSPQNENPKALVAQPLEQVSEDIVRLIRAIRPQVVVTFDPIGGYRHPDHITIHQATVRAFYAAGDPEQFIEAGPPFAPQKLYYHVIPHGFLRLAVRFMPLFRQDPRRFGRNKDIDLKSLTEVVFPIHARIDYRKVAAIRDQASACHESQGGKDLISGPVGWVRRQMSYTDMYMRAFPLPNGKVEKDLFEGVTVHNES